jgi:hypothetical protein
MVNVQQGVCIVNALRLIASSSRQHWPLLLGPLLFCGCSNSGAVERPVNAAIPQESSSLTPADTASKLVLQHDFGLLKPSSKVTHRFTIRNDSDIRWTFVKFHTSCACTVTHTAAPYVDAGQSVEVEVEYKAPAANVTERRHVGVQFLEAPAPFFWLEVKAVVRHAISMFPAELNFLRVGRGQQSEQSFEVHNFSNEDVTMQAIKPTVPWLTATFLPIEPSGEPRPRQGWRVLVHPKTDGLASGRHQGFLEVRTNSSETPVSRIPVNLHLTAPVEAIPAQMFFGNVTAGVEAKYRLLLRFTPDAIPADENVVELAHDVGEQMRVTCSKKDGGNWQIAATLTAPEKDGEKFIEGKLTIKFKQGNLAAIEVPVYAKVNNP